MKLAKDVTGDDPGKHVKFFPFAKDVRPFLWASDLFVQPSHYVPGSGGPEAFGLALLEAMASGLPVVAFACGGTLDLVQDGRTGWLAEPGSLDSLKSAISRAINALKFKQREQIDSEEIERFNVKNIAGEFVLLYKNVLSSSAR
jgi:glycosyltransferase involved in cell wall biosynthesis